MSTDKTVTAPQAERRELGLSDNLTRAQATFNRWPAWKQNYQPTKND